MGEWFLDVTATTVTGTQTWKADGATKAEALAKIQAGYGEFVGEELEVQMTNMNSLTVDHLSED